MFALKGFHQKYEFAYVLQRFHDVRVPCAWLIDSEFGGAHGWSEVGLKLRTSISFSFCSDFSSSAVGGAGRGRHQENTRWTRRAFSGAARRVQNNEGAAVLQRFDDVRVQALLLLDSELGMLMVGQESG